MDGRNRRGWTRPRPRYVGHPGDRIAYAYGGRGGVGGSRLLMALVLVLVATLSFCTSRQENPITGKKQFVKITPAQEIALGMQAAPQMAAQYGGLDLEVEADALVDRVGRRLVERSLVRASPYRFEFHVLRDPKTVNAFALPGGQVFITRGLLSRLTTEGQVAGILGHEIGHVVARHGAEHLAKQELTQGLTGAAVLATYDPDNPSSQRTAMVAALIGNLVNMKFGRDDEIESDQLGVRIMAEAGYDPRALIQVMEILAEAGRGRAPPEFFSTHPNPKRRVARIREAIHAELPNGVPDGLQR